MKALYRILWILSYILWFVCIFPALILTPIVWILTGKSLIFMHQDSIEYIHKYFKHKIK